MDIIKSFKDIVRAGRENIYRYDSTILMVTGLIGGVASLYLMHEATKKAEAKIFERQEELGRELTLKEKFQETWRDYAGVGILMIASDACIFAGHHKDISRGAAAYAAYRISEETIEHIDKKLEEEVGERKAAKIRSSANEEKMREIPVPLDDAIILTGHGSYLCFDRLSGRYFRSSISSIKDAITNANQQLQDEMYVTYNELCDYLDIPMIPLGDDIRWDINIHGFLTTKRWDYCGAENTGEPCLILDWEKRPSPAATHYRYA